MLQLINGKIKLTSLARSLKVSSTAMRFNLVNGSGLGKNAEKLGMHETADWILDKESVMTYLRWLRGKKKRIKQEDIERVEEECRNL